MQRWEYVCIAADGRDYLMNGKKQKYEKGEDMFFLLDKLGREGWEAISAGFHSSDRLYDGFLLKRPIEAADS